MPPIDPQQLLRALGPLLTDQGGIKGAQAALQIASLMKDASKLVSKCVYLNILRATESEEAFTKFIEVGGWDTLNSWLDMARNENNSPLLGELLEVYLRIPVTVALLKQNSAAKTIKKMQGKTEDDKLKTLSTQLVDVWMKTIRGQNIGTDADLDDKKKKKKHRDKDSEKEKDKNHEKDKDKNHKDSRKSKEEKENNERHKGRDKDSKERDTHDNIKDRKDRDRYKEKDRSRKDKSKDSSSKSSSSSSSTAQNKYKETISNSSKKPIVEDSKATAVSAPSAASAAEKSKSANADLNKEEESHRRLKTVKAIGSRIRSTGLFEEDEEEMDTVKKPADKSAIKRISNLESKGEESIEKKPRLHLNMPTLSTSGLTSSTTTPPEIMHGRIKIIPPKKPPAHEIQESNVFMDALQQSSSYASLGMKKKKKAASPSVTTPPVLLRGGSSVALSSSSTSTASATSPPLQGIDEAISVSEPGPTSPPLLSPTTAMAQKLPSVPSFYRDTLEEVPDSDKKEEKQEEGRDSPPTLDLMTPLNTQAEPGNEQEMEVAKPEEPLLDFGNAEDFQEVNIEEPPKSSKPKKRVSWARESQMEQIFYFEMDENERENVNRPKSFSDLKREEMMLDRRAMESAKRFNNDTMVEVLQWKLPKLIDNAIVVVEAGCNSVERQIQMEREQSVLCALFFNKVPDTPNEPDPEIPSEEEDVKIIPLEDENGSCTEYEHTYNFNDPSSLPYDPEFGALPLQGQNSQHSGTGGHAPNGHAGGGMGGPPPGLHGNMPGQSGGGGGNMGHMMSNLPPGITHILQVLKQQAQETRDPIMQNLQGMLTNVLQTTNPQDSGMLVDRILNALEPFMNQIPGLSNLINSVKGNGGMDFPSGGGPGGRFMSHPAGPAGPMSGGNPRHGLLGSAPPGFNMEGGGGGNMRPPIGMPSGPMSMMNNGGGNYFGGGGVGSGGMQMGGPPPGHWRGGGGGRSRPFKRGHHRANTVCTFYVKTRNCKYGDNCQFLHPNS